MYFPSSLLTVAPGCIEAERDTADTNERMIWMLKILRDVRARCGGKQSPLDQIMGGGEQEGPTSLASHSPNNVGQTLETLALFVRKRWAESEETTSPDQG